MRTNLAFRAVSGMIVGSALAFSALAPTAWAHHGGGTFSASRCFTFTGAVRKVAWANPHAWLYVQVNKSRGATELWGFEFGSISGLSRAGFRPRDFAVGTQVTVQAYANRDPAKRTASANAVVLSDGRNVRGGPIAGTAPAGGARPADCPVFQ